MQTQFTRLHEQMQKQADRTRNEILNYMLMHVTSNMPTPLQHNKVSNATDLNKQDQFRSNARDELKRY